MLRQAVVLVLVLGSSAAAFADDEVVVLADKPGGKRTLKPAKPGKPREIADGTVGVRDLDTEVPGDDNFGVKLDGITYAVPREAMCEVSGKKRSDGAMWLRCNESQGDFMHADFWYVPTLATRVRITEAGSDQEGVWAPTPMAPSVVVADEHLLVIDPTTAAVTKIDEAGSPSWNAAGVLHYRTLDGGAWKLDGGKKTKLGKGKKGKRARGDLSSGIRPTEWPDPVTFKKDGKPAWK